jgi:hypothetical protein
MAIGDVDERERGIMAKGFVWENEGLPNNQDERGKIGENLTIYITRLATYGFIWRRFDDLLMFHC